MVRIYLHFLLFFRILCGKNADKMVVGGRSSTRSVQAAKQQFTKYKLEKLRWWFAYLLKVKE